MHIFIGILILVAIGYAVYKLRPSFTDPKTAEPDLSKIPVEDGKPRKDDAGDLR